ncbi:acyltransferase [Roseomonas sp. SSH11]|uniref:Acyltransferase n=2 Tax=Pararoseomonas baculiformis TaxID=2820812 RepID=A0ABS4ABZ0_9PROT|nr:acyltransferase [Pararoseomonas baculiformis]
MVHCTMRGERSLIFLGHGLTSNRTNMLAEGPEGAVLVGDDAMFATGITIRTSDSHAIIDLGTRSQVNFPAPVVIEPHVWIGQDALLMKGVTIGAGSIVAGRAVVTGDVGPRVLVAGVPARVLRENVSWSRHSRPRPDQIEAMIGALPGADSQAR